MTQMMTSACAFALVLALGPAFAQVSPETLASISIPDKTETSIGTLEFFDGVPKDTTVAAVYDNLDRMRGTTVFLDNIGAVSMFAVRTGLADAMPARRARTKSLCSKSCWIPKPLSSQRTRRRFTPTPTPISPRTARP